MTMARSSNQAQPKPQKKTRGDSKKLQTSTYRRRNPTTTLQPTPNSRQTAATAAAAATATSCPAAAATRKKDIHRSALHSDNSPNTQTHYEESKHEHHLLFRIEPSERHLRKKQRKTPSTASHIQSQMPLPT